MSLLNTVVNFDADSYRYIFGNFQVVFLKNRYGFVRVAMEAGSPLVPTFCFGQVLTIFLFSTLMDMVTNMLIIEGIGQFTFVLSGAVYLCTFISELTHPPCLSRQISINGGNQRASGTINFLVLSASPRLCFGADLGKFEAFLHP